MFSHDLSEDHFTSQLTCLVLSDMDPNDTRSNVAQAFEEFRAISGVPRPSRGEQSAQSEIDYSDLLNQLESQEQSIIQHIRTSGLKKNRECALIDEIMDLRKNRRRTFTMLVKDLGHSQKCCASLENSIQNEKESTKRRYESEIAALRDDLNSKNSLLQRFEIKMKEKLESLHHKYQHATSDEVNKVRLKYESRLRELERIVSQVEVDVSSKEESILKQRIEEETTKIATKYNHSLQR
jgi:hypothetical protein